MKLQRVRYTAIAAVITAFMILMSACANTAGQVMNAEGQIDQGNKAAAGLEPFNVEKSADAPAGVGLQGMKVVAENGQYALFMDFKTTDFALLDKGSSKLFHSNPLRADQQIQVNGEIEAMLGSSLVVEFYDLSGNKGDFSTIRDCIPYGQFSFYSIDGGIRIVYTVGKDEGKRVIPPVLTTETYKKIYDKVGKSFKRNLDNAYKLISYKKLSSDVRDKYMKDFPALNDMDFYVTRGLNNRQEKFVEEAMAEAGFTLEDMQHEMKIAGHEVKDQAIIFIVPLDLKIDEKGFTASVDCNLIKGPKDQRVHKLSLLRGFGGTALTNGYMLVPDGSGALIELAKGEGNDVYSQRIYGEDETFAKSIIDTKTSQAVMPVFGLKAEESVVFGIIEEGAGLASVVARPISKVNPVACINTEFIVTERDYRDYTGLMRQPQGIILPKTGCTGTIKVRYGFLTGSSTDYSAMAGYYRQYLIERGILKNIESKELPFYLEIAGAVDKKVSVAGLPVNKRIPLTTYEQAIEIMKELAGKGVKGIQLKYTGWSNDGLNHSVMDKVELIKELGGSDEFEKLKTYLIETGTGFYPEADFNYVYRDEWFDNFKYKRDASRRLDMKTAYLGDYNSSTMRMSQRNTRYIVSPDRMFEYAGSFVKSLKEYLPVGGVSLRDIGVHLNSSYKTNAIIERDKAQQYYNDVLGLFGEKGYEVMVDKGNAYTWGYTKHIVNLPAGSSEMLSEKESVPFCQMVLHGYINYASNSFNSGSDIRLEVLKAIETGSAVYFRMMYEPNTALKKTSHENKYSMYYKDWLDDAARAYSEIAGIMAEVGNFEMTRHEKLDENVFATTYSNGKKIIVNYNDQDVNAGGMDVKAFGYALVEVNH